MCVVYITYNITMYNYHGYYKQELTFLKKGARIQPNQTQVLITLKGNTQNYSSPLCFKKH